jgi:hypothetical protein
MIPISAAGSSGGSNAVTTNPAQKRDVVLSCAHIFHEKCIGNFEKFLSGTVSRPVQCLHFAAVKTAVQPCHGRC